MDFGLHQVAIRAVARDRSMALRIFRNSLGLKAMWAIGALVLLIATATLLRHETDVRLAATSSAVSLVLRSYMRRCAASCRAWNASAGTASW